MGNVESGEMGSFWDHNPNDPSGSGSSRRGSASYYTRDEDPSYGRRSQQYVQDEDMNYHSNINVDFHGETEHYSYGGAAASSSSTAAAAAAATSATTNSDSDHQKVLKHGDQNQSSNSGEDMESNRASEDVGNSEIISNGDGGGASVARSSTVTHEINISKNQRTNQVAPEATTTTEGSNATTGVIFRSTSPSPSPFPVRDLPFAAIFLLHLLLTIVAIIYLNTVFLRRRAATQSKLQELQRWLPQLSASVMVGAIAGLLCQGLFRLYPNQAARSIAWVSSVFTLGTAIMLLSTGTAANLGVGVLVLVTAIAQCLYGVYAHARMKYAGDVLFCSLSTAAKAPGGATAYLVSYWLLAAAAVWLLFWSFGVASALVSGLRRPPAPCLVFGLLVSVAWTMEVLRNMVLIAAARGVSAAVAVAVAVAHPANPASRPEPRAPHHWEGSLYSAYTAWFGSICLGSLLIPIVHVLGVMGRAMDKIHVDNEFMFSCADCFHRITHKLSMYANNWAFVQVAQHRKPFIKAAKETSELFASKRLDVVVSTDLTSSFCVLSGILGGMMCALVSGGWTFGTHKALTSSVSIVCFFIGYFLVRLMMAVPQGAVCAHYVCYAQNPASHELLTSPIPERLKELLPEVDTEIATK